MLVSPTMQALAAVSKRKCLPRGQYKFVMRDTFCDCICYGAGQGHFAVKVNGLDIGSCTGRAFRKRSATGSRWCRGTIGTCLTAHGRGWLGTHLIRSVFHEALRCGPGTRGRHLILCLLCRHPPARLEEEEGFSLTSFVTRQDMRWERSRAKV